MEIFCDTRYDDVKDALKFLKPGEEARLIDVAERHLLGDGGWWGITVGTFIKATRGDLEDLHVTKDGQVTCYGYYLVKGFGAFVDEFIRVARNLTPPASPSEPSSAGCYQIQIDEAMLVFCRRYFGLHSFREAEQITLAEWLIARRDEFNRVILERNSMRKLKK